MSGNGIGPLFVLKLVAYVCISYVIILTLMKDPSVAEEGPNYGLQHHSEAAQARTAFKAGSIS